jgi:DNA repair protein SbcD/Mre11
VHLDSTFGCRLGQGRGARKREAIRNTFRRIVDDCIAWPADILVIAGDLFEEERVSSDTIGFLKAQFARLKDTPVVIAPGNHDPFTVSSRYAVTDWGPNVRLFTRGSLGKFSFPSLGVDVYGAAHVSTHMSGRLTDLVGAVASDVALPVLVIHASNEASIPSDKAADDIWLPFSRAEIERLGYGYVALGHYHAPSDFTANGRIIAAYPGSPEGLRASEVGRRHYARVTLDRAGAKVEKMPVSEIDFAEFEIPCDSLESREGFIQAVMSLDAGNAAALIARIRATGRVVPGFDLSARLPAEIYERFFYVSIIDETVPAYDWDAIAAEKSLRGEVVRRFAAEIASCGPAAAETLEKARIYALDALAGRPIELPGEVLRVD